MKKTALKLGSSAPDFTLLNQEGDEVSLKEFKGKKNVVVYFYPKAMTPGCTVQAHGIRDHAKDFAKLQTVVLGISPDAVKRLVAFTERDELNFQLLADEDHKVAEAYKAWGLKKNYGKEYMGILRSTFIVDKAGKLVHMMPKVTTKTHADDVLAWIRENL